MLDGKLIVATVSALREGLYMASGGFGIGGTCVSNDPLSVRRAVVGTEGISLGPNGLTAVGYVAGLDAFKDLVVYSDCSGMEIG